MNSKTNKNFRLKFHNSVIYSIKDIIPEILKIPGVLRCELRGNFTGTDEKIALIECTDFSCRSAVEKLLRHGLDAPGIKTLGDIKMSEEPKKIDKFKDSMSGVLGALSEVIADAEASSRKIQAELRIESQAQVDKVKLMGDAVKKEIQETLSTLIKRVEATESRLDRVEKLVDQVVARLDAVDVRLENAQKALKK